MRKFTVNIYYSLAIRLDTRRKEMNPDCPFFSCAGYSRTVICLNRLRNAKSFGKMNLNNDQHFCYFLKQ